MHLTYRRGRDCGKLMVDRRRRRQTHAAFRRRRKEVVLQSGFAHVSTHLSMPELSRPAAWEAWAEGRAYVAFDWMADPTGFVCFGLRGGQRWNMGGEVVAGELRPGMLPNPIYLRAPSEETCLDDVRKLPYPSGAKLRADEKPGSWAPDTPLAVGNVACSLNGFLSAV